MDLKLNIVSPERQLFSGEVELVELPGAMGRFEVLHNHAPLVSSLTAGNVTYRSGSTTDSLSISGGFVEVRDNVVTVCAEL